MTSRSTALPFILSFVLAAPSLAATIPTDQSHTQSSDVVIRNQQAQDSANGSMSNTDLSGQVDKDTSALTTGTASGATSGAIIDQTSKKKKKKKKKTGADGQKSEGSAAFR